MGRVWIGMAEVLIGPGCTLELSGVGAFAWCATQADDGPMFVQKVEEMLKHYGLIPMGFEDVRCIEDSAELPEELAEIADKAGESSDHVLYGTFHTFDRHNA